MEYHNASVHPENKNGQFRPGYYTAGGFVASEPRKRETGSHFPPELFIAIPIIGAIVFFAITLI